MRKFNTANEMYELVPAEVLEVDYTSSNPEMLYAIKCKLRDGRQYENANSDNIVTATPIDVNNVKLPVVGEFVTLMKSISPTSDGLYDSSKIYYVNVVSLQNSNHHNSIPTATKVSVQNKNSSGNSDSYQSNSPNRSGSKKVDSNFVELSGAENLQPYPGDTLISGRYGSSLRLGASPKSNIGKAAKYKSEPGKPITILRNSSVKSSGNTLVTENFNSDESFLVLSSGQELEFENSSIKTESLKKSSIDSWKSNKWGTDPTALLKSGRVALNADSSDIVAFAKKGIGLSATDNIAIESGKSIILESEKIELGLDSKEPLVLGNVFKKWMEDLITEIGKITVITPTGLSSPLQVSPEWVTVLQLKAKLSDLLSELSYTSKK